MTFRAWDRVIYLLALGFAASSCVLNAPLANAARSPSGEWVEGSAQQSVTVEDVQRILAEDKGNRRQDLHLPSEECLAGRNGIDGCTGPVRRIHFSAGYPPLERRDV